MKKLSFAVTALVSGGLLAFLPAACGGSLDETINPVSPGDGGTSRIDGPLVVPGLCHIEVDAPAFLPATHVAVGTHVDYDSNPPSSGPHYPIWAAYQAYDKPVQREYYVHDMEHGGVVLLYKCASADGCPDVVAALRSVSDAIPTDPLCDPGVRVRTVITPDPLLDVPVAAAAWGFTYRAACLDVPSLTAFAKEHYGKGPETTCANGSSAL